MKLTALKSFSPRGASLIRQHTHFTASEADAEIYIRNGLATIYNGSQAPRTLDGEATEPIDIYTEDEMLEKNVTELRKIAKNKGVSGYTRMSKSELIFAILASQQNDELQDMEG